MSADVEPVEKAKVKNSTEKRPPYLAYSDDLVSGEPFWYPRFGQSSVMDSGEDRC